MKKILIWSSVAVAALFAWLLLSKRSGAIELPDNWNDLSNADQQNYLSLFA